MSTIKRNYKRTFEELEQVASKFWPTELSALEAKLSVIPLLLKTQDDSAEKRSFITTKTRRREEIQTIT